MHARTMYSKTLPFSAREVKTCGYIGEGPLRHCRSVSIVLSYTHASDLETVSLDAHYAVLTREKYPCYIDDMRGR